MSDQRERDMAEMAELDHNLMPEVTVQADIGGRSIAFVAHVAVEEFRSYLDEVARAIDREKARQRLLEELGELKGREKTLAEWSELRTKALRGIAEKKAAKRAEMMAQGRSDRLTLANERALMAFDAQLEAEDAKYANIRRELEEQIPEYRRRVARQRAILNGANPADMFDDFGALPQAAE